MSHMRFAPLLVAAIAVLAPLAAAAPAAADETNPAIVTLDEVRPGMTGYGLTVFRGVEPEPFAVEVVSVIHMAGPQRSIIWIESDDERLKHTGAVQGMSGSPIYLWTDDEAERFAPGEGGRLAGAFAFGYAMNKDPIIGVQPAEYMLGIRERLDEPRPRVAQRRGATLQGQRTIRTLDRLASQRNASELSRLNLDLARRLLLDDEARGPAEHWDADRRGDEGVQPLLLPLAVGSSQTSSLVRPLLEPLGLAPIAGGPTGPGAVRSNTGISPIAGPPPHGVNVEDVSIVPGGVLSVPLVWGDLDLALGGTVTEVLEDGTVLGLGHPMFGEGPTALPMATGHVHFIVPRLNISFKVSGSLAVAGALLADETPGVAGRLGERGLDSFASAPLQVDVAMPGHERQSYSYHVADHPWLTPTLAVIAALESVLASQQLPDEHTMRITGRLEFSDGHHVDLNSLSVGEGIFGLLMELLPPLATLTQNPWQSLRLVDGAISAEIEPELRIGRIVDARLDHGRVEPGASVGLTVWVEPYGRAVEKRRIALEIPRHTPEGEYRLTVSGAARYINAVERARPHRGRVRSIDDLVQVIQEVLDVERDALYVTMELPEQGVAVGRQELAHLPSSRRAMIARPTHTLATPYRELLEQKVAMDVAIQGDRTFTVRVEKE